MLKVNFFGYFDRVLTARFKSKPAPMIHLRAATEIDQPEILAIYNEAVLNTTATFDTEPRSMDAQMEWFRRHKKNHPILVAEINKKIIGWASLSPWSDRCAYETTVEVSVYIDKDFRAVSYTHLTLPTSDLV